MNKTLSEIRTETPNTGNLIHFNNAGSSLMPQPVYDAQLKYQNEEWQEGGYETMVNRSADLDLFYSEGARLLNCLPSELAFTDSATTSWQRVFFAIDWKDGDEIITANAEYASNYIAFLRLKKLFNIEVKVAEDLPTGEVDVNSIESLITERTKLVAITHMPTLSGLVNPIEEIGSITSKKGIFYLVDACQSVGQYPLDVDRIKCDFLSGTGRKYLRAPRGTGLLYVRSDVTNQLDPLSLDLVSASWETRDRYKLRKGAMRFETFEANLAAKAGLAAAFKYQNDLGIEASWQRIQLLADALRSNLQNLGATVQDRGAVQSGIVTFSVPNMSPPQVQERLSAERINVSNASVFNSRLYMERYQLDALVRASVHYFNTEDEIEIFTEKITKILS